MTARFFLPTLALLLTSLSIFSGDAKKEEEFPIKSLQLTPGLDAWVWAHEKQITNPVAICIDEKNRIYVAETLRFRIGGGLDARAILFMFLDDLRCAKLEERSAIIEKWKDRFPADFFTKYSERITRFADTKGTGKADEMTVFSDNYNHPLDGPCAGLVARNGKVYFTCIPKVYELTDADDDGKAEKKEVMFDGFGVRFGISGHDLHGIVFGPDGKLYWSMGDRGFNLNTKEGKHLLGLGTGGVFRCNPDGSDLELYYHNLRNPQEIAFDDFGDLFSCDNNADIGDQARVVYIVEGASTGWHQGWQVLSYGRFAETVGLKTHKPNPWLAEGLWKLRHDGQPAWILPPVAHITNGPCGVAYYPGTGLPEKYNNHFFVADYTGGTNSGVHSFTLEQDGAGFKMPKPEKMVWGVACTDVAFGYDGNMYVSDYMGGWHSEQRYKGRIIGVKHPDAVEKQKTVIAEVQKLFAENQFKKLPSGELMKLLAHVDQRVRQYAQFELAGRGKEGGSSLAFTALNNENLKARLHGIWGTAMAVRAGSATAKTLIELLNDKESRVREQSAKMLGDLRVTAAAEKLVELLKDENPRVRMFSAIALGRIGHKPAVPALVELLRANDSKDAFVRHGAVQGLAYINDAAQYVEFEKDTSKAVRLGICLVYRKLESPRIANFLKDSDDQIYAEAIRGIYEVPILAAAPALGLELKRHLDAATAPGKGKMAELLYHRILYAAQRYGGPEQAAALAEFAAKSNVEAAHRALALTLLETWDQPTEVDPAWGQCRPVAKRDRSVIREAIKPHITWLLSNGKDDVLAKAISLAISYGFELKDEILISALNDPKASEALRLESLKRFVDKKDARLKEFATKLLTDGNTAVRVAAMGALLQADTAAGIEAANGVLTNKVARSGTYVLTDKTASGFDTLKTGAPSSADYASKKENGATFTWVKSFTGPHALAGAVGDTLPRLNDGALAQNNDDTGRTVWLDGNESRLLLDLKKSIEIARINTYSWHKGNRAPQTFTLWGANGDTAPDPSNKNLSKSKDWTKIADVDTNPLGDSGQHGSAVFNPAGTLGKFRYVMWQNAKRAAGTFYTEMDVYEQGQPLPPLESPENTVDQKVRQEALMLLGRTPDPKAGEIVAAWMDQFLANKAPAALHLDILEAAGLRGEEAIKGRIEKYKKTLPEDDRIAPLKPTLNGGDVKSGKQIFEFHGAACLRCHKLGGQGGDAGPNLAGVGKRLTREKILESLIEPNAAVVEGYGVTTLRMNDGTVITGNIQKESQFELEVKLADGKVQKVKPADIKKKVPPVSPMPTMDGVMKPHEIRDLIAYLMTQQ